MGFGPPDDDDRLGRTAVVRSPSGEPELQAGAEPEVADIRLGRVFLAVASVAVLFVTYVLHAALPVSALELPFQNRDAVRQVMPEGWGFFTASPRTVYPRVYRLRDGRWRPPGESLVVPSGLFGVDRSQRAEGTEAALLIHAVPPDAWTSCDRRPDSCLEQAPVAAVLGNDSTLRRICGDIGFVNQEVLPWAWRRSATIMPSTVVRVEVRC